MKQDTARIHGKEYSPGKLKEFLTETSKDKKTSVTIEVVTSLKYTHVVKILKACVSVELSKVDLTFSTPVTSAHKYSGGVYKKPVTSNKK